MFEQPKFKIIYSEEVIDFLNYLNEKVKEKIMFNINKSKYVIDNELQSLHFGIQRMIH